MGRATRLPPQFGHFPPRIPSAQLAQNVHSNEQILACGESGGRSPLQHSQQGLISSIRLSKIDTGQVCRFSARRSKVLGQSSAATAESEAELVERVVQWRMKYCPESYRWRNEST